MEIETREVGKYINVIVTEGIVTIDIGLLDSNQADMLASDIIKAYTEIIEFIDKNKPNKT